jgi:hypothetical protein
VCHDDATATLRNAVENIRALRETKPAPAKPCMRCSGSGGVYTPAAKMLCPECAEVKR